MQDAADLIGEVVQVAVIDDYIIGPGSLLVKGKLRILTTFQLRLRPAPGFRQASVARVAGGLDEDHGVALAIETRLVEQRRVDDECSGVPVRRGELLLHSPSDPWV